MLIQGTYLTFGIIARVVMQKINAIIHVFNLIFGAACQVGNSMRKNTKTPQRKRQLTDCW